MREIVITGYTGFIGHNLGEYFQKHGLRVQGCNLREGVPASLPDDVQAIIHLAGKAHDLKNAADPAEYFAVNYELTRQLYEKFIASSAEVFIFMSSVKACADVVEDILTEDAVADPQTAYGKSKRLAEEYILSKQPGRDKRVYILRPCMVHGPGNKGNLNLLYGLASKNIPWPLGAFENERSFCSIDNLCFVMEQLVKRTDIPSGIYNVADDVPVSTNKLISIIAECQKKRPRILRLSRRLIKAIASVGDYLSLPLNTERLQKLTESYVVSNQKLLQAIGTKLPLSSYEGLKKTILSFKNAD